MKSATCSILYSMFSLLLYGAMTANRKCYGVETRNLDLTRLSFPYFKVTHVKRKAAQLLRNGLQLFMLLRVILCGINRRRKSVISQGSFSFIRLDKHQK